MPSDCVGVFPFFVFEEEGGEGAGRMKPKPRRDGPRLGVFFQ